MNKPKTKQSPRGPRTLEEAGKRLQAHLEQQSDEPGAFAEAMRLTLAMQRLGGVTTKAQRTAQLHQSIDGGLREDLAKYSTLVLKRLPKLLREELAKRESEDPKVGHRPPTEERLMQRAAWLHDTFVRHGLPSEEADELIAGLVGVESVRTVQRYRTRQKAQKKTPS